ncbi:MAG: MarR family transcriptional regulator [Rhodoglobus sp.]|jgi:DNA-binding MarR family transcriptional regulator|nr:MarR family transcriptional regulator [Rhodoglobus sp.]
MTTETTQHEKELWRSFYIMRRQLELTLERRLQADAGISTADYEILIALFNDPSKQLRAGQIGDLIGWEKSRVSHQITRMEQRELVKRQECGDDARGVWVVLTEDGSRAVLNAERDRRDAVRQYFFDVLDDDEKSVLLRISHKVLDTIAPPICDEVNAPA